MPTTETHHPETSTLADAARTIAERIAETVQREASVRTVFGEPIKLETHNLVPVAAVVIHIGGSAGGGGTSGAGGKIQPFGGGGGLDINVVAKPIGFISEAGGEVRFQPIASSAADHAGQGARAKGGIRLRAGLLGELIEQVRGHYA
jgi:uncharacterized spore protein YtfJ